MDLKVKVIPRSRKTEFAGKMEDGTLKIKISAIPEDGKANKELCSFLARYYEVPQANVSILSGATSQRKLVRVLE